MKAKILASVLMTSLLQACGGAQADNGSDTSANTASRQLWLNGDIYTVNKEQPWAEAMVIEKGQLLFVGPEAEAKNWVNENTQIHDLQGKTVLPGLHDVHLHPLEAASEEIQCVLDSSRSISDWVGSMKLCAQQNPQVSDDEWLLGWGHSILTLVESKAEPRALLDAVSDSRPIAIMEETSHSVWVNSRALELLNLEGSIAEQDIQGGAVLLNAENKSIGVLLDGAGDLAFDLAMAETPERLERNYQSLLAGLDEVAKHGITSIVDARIYWQLHGITSIVDARIYWQRGYLKAWQRARDEDALTARSVLSLWAYPNMDDEKQIKQLTAMYENDLDSLLRINQIKFYSDGITHNATSALLAPYNNYYEEVGPTGLNYFDEERLTHYVSELSKVGFNMHIHAIGDRAVRESLNAIEEAQRSNKNTGRHRLTHVEMVAEADKKRFSNLNVVADFQLAGEFTHPENFVEMEPLIGHRAHQQLPVRDIYETGATVTLSSDWDVSSLSPFVGMQNAITRGEQGLPDLAAAVEAYTINGAYVMDQEHITGSLEAGKEADFIIIDQNIFELDVHKISETKVLKTILAGEIVYQN